jgi:hypothetical protein
MLPQERMFLQMFLGDAPQAIFGLSSPPQTTLWITLWKKQGGIFH